MRLNGATTPTWSRRYRAPGRRAVEEDAGAGEGRADSPGGVQLELRELRRSHAGAVEGDDFAGRDDAGWLLAPLVDGADGQAAGERLQQADRVVAGIGDVDVAGRNRRRRPAGPFSWAAEARRRRRRSSRACRCPRWWR